MRQLMRLDFASCSNLICLDGIVRRSLVGTVYAKDHAGPEVGDGCSDCVQKNCVYILINHDADSTELPDPVYGPGH
jgi:hypothetical protein